MVIDINEFLNLILVTSLIVLVIIFIVVGIRLIGTLKKIDVIIADVNDKMNKVDGVFDIIDKTTDYAVSISDKIIGAIVGFLGGKFKKKKGNDDDEYKEKWVR